MQEAHKAGYEEMPELGQIWRKNFLEDEDGQWYRPIHQSQRPGTPAPARFVERVRDLPGRAWRLRQFRSEAVRAGFAEAYREKKYAIILQVAARLPEEVLHEDPDLLMYFDTASLRTAESH